MATLTLEKVVQNPVWFLRLFMPVCHVLPGYSASKLISVYEFLTNAESLVELKIFTKKKLARTLKKLKNRGFEPVTCDKDVQRLAEHVAWRLEGTEILKRGFPVDDMLWCLRAAALKEPRRFRLVISAAEHQITCHTYQKDVDNCPQFQDQEFTP